MKSNNENFFTKINEDWEAMLADPTASDTNKLSYYQAYCDLLKTQLSIANYRQNKTPQLLCFGIGCGLVGFLIGLVVCFCLVNR